MYGGPILFEKLSIEILFTLRVYARNPEIVEEAWALNLKHRLQGLQVVVQLFLYSDVIPHPLNIDYNNL